MDLIWRTEDCDVSSAPNAKAKTRKARQREMQRKRARGEASCAECRRLKVRCDKKVPCSSCVRRGCHTICPNGWLATGQGSRLVLANTEKLYEKLLQMSQRIRQLEDALELLQSTVSSKPHPLLTEELLSIKSGFDVLVNNNNEEDDFTDDEEAMTTAMGTLTVSESGATRFVGRVGAETLLLNEPADDTIDYSDSSNDVASDLEQELPKTLVHSSKGFPFSQTYLGRERLIALVKLYLPSYERATALAEAYLGNLQWCPLPIKREQIMEDLLPSIYDRRCNQVPPVSVSGSQKYNGMHKIHCLSLVMAIFACGTAADYTLPLNNSEAKQFHTLALAALNTYSITSAEGASLETVQAIMIIAAFDFVACGKHTAETATKILAIGLVIATSIGLHRDPAHWDMEPKYTQRRRHAFWELFTLDKWKSLGSGSPPIFHLQDIDCEFPEDEDAFVDEEGKHVEGSNRWRHRFSKEVLGPLSEKLCLTRPVKYSELLEFDRKIREFEEPRLLPDEGPGGNVKERLWSTQKDIALLAIHRNFIARAMSKRSMDPLLNSFAPSYLAAYVYSVRLLRTTRECFDINPATVIRVWPIWTHVLLSGVIVGSFILKTDQKSLASGAFCDLEVAVSLFQEASHPIARRGLPILLRLRERARIALQAMANESGPPSESSDPENAESEELDILRDTARLIRRVSKTKDGSFVGDSSSSSNSGDRNNGQKPDSGNAVSSLANAALEFSGTSGLHQIDSPDKRFFAHPSAEVPTDSSAALPPTYPTGSFTQSSSGTIDHDIAAILNRSYNNTFDVSSARALAAPHNLCPQPYGQIPLPPVQSYPQYSYHSENCQTSQHFSDDPATVTHCPTVSGAMASGSAFNTTIPAFDFSWLEAGDPKEPSYAENATELTSTWCFRATARETAFYEHPRDDSAHTS